MLSEKMIKVTFFLLSLVLPTFVSSKPPPKIGIIGGGIGGTSCAYFLNDLFQSKASISLFERDEIGGRLRIINIDGKGYEAGGSIIHSRNQHMVQFAQLLGLSDQPPHEEKFGLYNGENFVLEDSDWHFVTIAKMLWRYGFSIFNLFNEIKSMLDDFSRIYSTQEKRYAFTSVDMLLKSMNPLFADMTQSSIQSILQEKGYPEKLLNELVQSVMLVNYGQTNNISGFAGFVSLAGAGSNLWSVKGGNYLIPKGLLQKSGASFIVGNVIEIILLPDRTFSVKYEENTPNKEIKLENFDIVILSAPLIKGNENIKFVNFEKSFHQFKRTYHQTVATFIKGTLKPQAFHQSQLPDDILTNNSSLLFNSIGKLSKNIKKYKEHIYKIFSQKSLEKDYIENLFEDVQFIEEKIWLAYPHYNPPEKPIPFILHPGLYYTNAIELSASAIEMSAISAKNIALLIFNLWENFVEKIDSEQSFSKDEL